MRLNIIIFSAEKAPTRLYRYNAVEDRHHLPGTIAGIKQSYVGYVCVGCQRQARKTNVLPAGKTPALAVHLACTF